MWVATIGSKRKPKSMKEEKSLTKDLNTGIGGLGTVLIFSVSLEELEIKSWLVILT